MIGTDGRQLLIQSGFEFPWKDDVLIPRVRAFGLRELAEEAPIAITRVNEKVFVRAGFFTFILDVRSGRFPDVQHVIPRQRSDLTSHLQINREDAVFLIDALPKLPGHGDDNAPVTLDLGDKMVLRARSEGSAEITEVELSRSTCKGPPIRLVLNRTYLDRALRLGCTKIAITGADPPVVFEGENRLYVAVPLHKDGAIAPSDRAVRITSIEPKSIIPQTKTPRRTPMPSPHSNGHSTNGASNGTDTEHERTPALAEMVAEAEHLRSQIQEVLGRLTRLLSGLKQFRRQSRAVSAAVQSLRGLKLEG